MVDKYPEASSADIVLILEGTYPFVTGGVSNWIHQLLTHLSQYNFAIIFLGGQKSDYGSLLYQLPRNVVHLETHYLFDLKGDEVTDQNAKVHQSIDLLSRLHENFKTCPNDSYGDLFKELDQTLFGNSKITLKYFLHHPISWEFLVESYLTRSPNISFLDYFWTVQNLHIPIWRLVEIAEQAPAARCLHSASTGFAGFLAALIHLKRNYPFILTEHGIYVKERRIELLNQWMDSSNLLDTRTMDTKEYLTNLWIHFFEGLAKMSYTLANPIISLFNDYRLQQIKDGAPGNKTIIIPNGIKIYEGSIKLKPNASPIIAFIGRVVPIKDVKTFIRAIVAVIQKIPAASAMIIGSLEEDKKYVKECRDLVNILNLNEKITFTGVQKIDAILPEIDLVVLTSISEGLPLVILEAQTAGIPVVATDVGACRELLYGSTDSDKALGKSGTIVEISNIHAIANAILDFLNNKDKWTAASNIGRTRVKQFYSEQQLLDRYTQIYDEALKWQE